MNPRVRWATLSFVACAAIGCSNDSSGGSKDSDAGTDAGDSETSTPGGGSSLVLVAAGGLGTSQTTQGYTYDVATDTWSAGTSLGDGTRGAIESPNGGLSFAFTGTNSALAVLTAPTDTTDASGASGPVQFATWTSGTWAPFAAVGSGVTATGAPSLAVGTASTEIAFAGDGTLAESSAALAAGAWSTVSKLGSSLKGGPPSLAVRGADATVAYVRSSDNALVAVDRTSGTWGTESVIESGTAAAAAITSFAPSLIALTGTGPELMVVYTDSMQNDLHFATRTGTQWSAVQDFGLPTKVINTDPSRPNAGAGDSPSPSFATPVLALLSQIGVC
jgi:hypothetical protein